MAERGGKESRVRVAEQERAGLARAPETTTARAPETVMQPNVALTTEQRREVARLASAAPPTTATTADLGLAQRLDPGSMTMLNRLVGGNLARQQHLLVSGGEPQQGVLSKVLASEYLAGCSPTLELANPIFSRSDYSEQDILTLLASYATPDGGLSDAQISEALLASRSWGRRFLRRLLRR